MINFPLKTVYLDTVDSTNNYIKSLIKGGTVMTGTAVVAKEQTSGRGRLGRVWQSKAGDSLCMSIALKCENTDGFTLLVALAIFDALSAVCDKNKLSVKWPNDIICGKKKLCGILCERVDEYTVIGIGVNVNDESFHPEIANKATSLFMLTGEKLDINAVADKISFSLENTIKSCGYTFTEQLRNRYTALCANIGKEVKWSDFCGTAAYIASDGSLVVRIADGTLKNVGSGEVTVNGIY